MRCKSGRFPQVTGVFHCYSGSAEMARRLVSQGWYIGFTGVITFKNARKLVETAMAIPLTGWSSKRTAPIWRQSPSGAAGMTRAMFTACLEKLAELRGISPEEMQKITMENGKRLYRLN